MNAIIDYFTDYRKSFFVRAAIYVGFIFSTIAATFLMLILFVMLYRFNKFIGVAFIILPFIFFTIEVFLSIFVGTDEEAEESPCYITDEEAYDIVDLERDEAALPVFDNDEVRIAYCPNCGAPLHDGKPITPFDDDIFRFCEDCGQKLDWDDIYY